VSGADDPRFSSYSVLEIPEKFACGWKTEVGVDDDRSRQAVRCGGGLREMTNVQLRIIIQGSPNADKYSIVHRAHPVCHDHAFFSTKNKLLPIFSSNFCINGLSKSQCDMWIVVVG